MFADRQQRVPPSCLVDRVHHLRVILSSIAGDNNPSLTAYSNLHPADIKLHNTADRGEEGPTPVSGEGSSARSNPKQHEDNNPGLSPSNTRLQGSDLQQLLQATDCRLQ